MLLGQVSFAPERDWSVAVSLKRPKRELKCWTGTNPAHSVNPQTSADWFDVMSGQMDRWNENVELLEADSLSVFAFV